MKTFSTKPLGILPVMLALLLGAAPRGYASPISVWPDSLTMSTSVGTSTESEVYVLQSGDTTLGMQEQTVHVSLSGSSEFTLESDSILQFLRDGTISIRYAPTSSSVTEAVLTIVGDSNTAYVTLIGQPLSHIAPNILVGNYYNVPLNEQTCHPFEVYNTNATSISVTNVILMQASGMGWSLDNLVLLPHTIAGNSNDTMGQVCLLPSLADTFSSGSLKIIYTYGTGTDSISIDLQGYHRALSSVCVQTSGGSFGAVAEGASVTRTITLTNVTDTSIYLDSAQIVFNDYSQFAINSSPFPVVLEPDSSVNVSVTFTAPSLSTKDNYYASFLCAVQGPSPDDIPCTSVGFGLSASVSFPVVDSITLDVPPGSTSLSITAHTDKSRHAIFIHNADTSTLLTESLSVSGLDSLAFFGSQGETETGVYDSLLPGMTIGPILLTLEAPDTGTYNLDLTLTYSVQQAHQKGAVPTSNSLSYTVVAHRLPPISEAVSEPNAPATTDFALMPNPARDAVTIMLPDGAPSSVQVYDVLGNLILSRVAQGEFVWDGESNTGSLANGTYIVRVSQGHHTSSKRLVIVR
ncbi:MAG: T9SS type A sorting domain-containing protein [Candidatus Kapaibacterium sp.]